VLLRRPRLLIALLLLIALAAALTLLNQPVSRRIPIPVVIADMTGPAETVRPDETMIAEAQALLGADGFIAYITCNTTSEYHARQAREMGDFAAAYGLDYRVYDSDNSMARQIPLIERARVEGAVGLMVCPLDPDLLDETLRDVDQADVPLVLMNGDMKSYGGVLIAGDDYLMGLAAGRAAGQIIRD
jgi:ABC-type sugar transport system substrate-binding protein